jgi:hypothetical protein
VVGADGNIMPALDKNATKYTNTTKYTLRPFVAQVSLGAQTLYKE